MNLLAVDIGNTNIGLGLFLKDEESTVESVAGEAKGKVEKCLVSMWEKIPVVMGSKEKKRDGFIVVSSVKPEWTKVVRQIAKEKLDERIYVVGKEVGYPMDLSVKEPDKVGSDRVLSAAAAYAVIEDAAVVIDFGTALTIDLVDERGIYLGGVICPGFQMSASALHESTALLPEINVSHPEKPYGQTTEEAINCGLYYSAVGTIKEVVEQYAEAIGKWPQTILTGAAILGFARGNRRCRGRSRACR